MITAAENRARPLILLIGYCDSRSTGGSLRVLETLSKSLPAEGFDVEIVFAYGESGGVCKTCDCPVHLIRARGCYDVLAWLRVRKLIKKRRAAILQFVDNVNWLILAVQGIHIKTLLYAHGRTIWRRKALQTWLLTWLQFWLSDGIITISYGVKRSLVSLGLIHPRKIWIVHNALDRRFEETNISYQSIERYKPRQTKVLGMACRLTVQKGVLDAVEIIRLLPDPWKLIIAGEGPARKVLERRIIDYGLSTRVRLLGNTEDMNEFYQDIDYYLFLSRYEPFGLVLAEAMFAGVPVVGLRSDGEYAESEYPLIDDSNAILLMREDPFDYERDITVAELSALVAQLQALHKDVEKQKIITANAHERVHTHFMAAHQAKKLATIYQSVLVSY
jgi:glycosyltransferase involved in cell wall biosynthesis